MVDLKRGYAIHGGFIKPDANVFCGRERLRELWLEPSNLAVVRGASPNQYVRI